MSVHSLDRRGLLKVGVLSGLSAAAAFPHAEGDGRARTRKFLLNLSCGRIGCKATFVESVDLAIRNGFEAVDPDPVYFARLSNDQMDGLLGNLKEKGLKLGAGSLPVDFRKDDTIFSDGLRELPAFCQSLRRAGVSRVGTYFLSFDNDLTYLQNFRSHAYRLRLIAGILKDHGQRLGLEYLGPMTLWRSSKHPFIHTMSETKELIAAIGTDNVGFHLDSWHWFTAGETEADIRSLKNEDITDVDLNDAPAGLSLDQQIDSQRELPLATGVIPVKSFLDALRQINFDGPIHAEPFNEALRLLPSEQAVANTAIAMKKAFAL